MLKAYKLIEIERRRINMLRKTKTSFKIIGIALIANLLVSSAIYSAPKEKQGGGGGGRVERSAPVQSAPVQSRAPSVSMPAPSRAPSMPAPSMNSRPGGFEQRQSIAPPRISTPPPVSRPPVIQQQAPPARIVEPPRNNASVNRNVNVNPPMTVRSPRETPSVSVAPPASQNRNNSAPPVIRDNGMNNRPENQPQMNIVNRGNERAPAIDRSSVVINQERTSKIGANIGEGRTSERNIAKENTRVNQGAANRENRISDRTSQIAKPIGPDNARNNSDRTVMPNTPTTRVGGNNRNENAAKVTIPQSRTDRIGSVIGQTSPDNRIAKPGNDRTERQTVRLPETRTADAQRTANTIREELGKVRDNRSSAPVTRENRNSAGTVSRDSLNTRSLASTRIERSAEQLRPGHREERTITSGVREVSTVREGGIVDTRADIRSGSISRTIRYEDRPFSFRHNNRFEFAFRDRHHSLNTFFIWPSYYCWVGYNWGPDWSFSYYYPYYHRRYVFVSLGGFWPSYTYMRYFWYGYHPYYWYGYDPVPQYYGSDTYNYYTYNNYYDSAGTTSDYSTSSGLPPVNENTFADVRARMQQQAERTPDTATQADQYFDEAVQAFEKGAYNLAVDKFEQAMKIAPDDMILPYAYAQALVATEQYTQAADVLRTALAKVTPDKESVFYPRGLYANDDVLTEQIKILTDKATVYPLDADLQLILGYQMLGLGDLDGAQKHLDLATGDIRNAPAANTLIDLLAKMKAKVQTSGVTQPSTPNIPPDMQSSTKTELGPAIESESQVSSNVNWLPMDMIAKRFEQWKSQYFDTVLFAFYRYA
jgi:tetratricopeptide (TPR) repeat protein